MKIGDTFYSKKFIMKIDCQEKDDMFGITFNSRDGLETNYNIISEAVIKSMIDHKEWFEGEDPWK